MLSNIPGWIFTRIEFASTVIGDYPPGFACKYIDKMDLLLYNH